jgi:hypothetical protein
MESPESNFVERMKFSAKNKGNQLIVVDAPARGATGSCDSDEHSRRWQDEGEAEQL